MLYIIIREYIKTEKTAHFLKEVFYFFYFFYAQIVKLRIKYFKMLIAVLLCGFHRLKPSLEREEILYKTSTDTTCMKEYIMTPNKIEKEYFD